MRAAPILAALLAAGCSIAPLSLRVAGGGAVAPIGPRVAIVDVRDARGDSHVGDHVDGLLEVVQWPYAVAEAPVDVVRDVLAERLGARVASPTDADRLVVVEIQDLRHDTSGVLAGGTRTAARAVLMA